MASETREAVIRRPRTDAVRERELLAAALVVLRRVGYESLTMDAVAAEARCSKATLYRLWPSKADLVAAALYADRPAVSGEISTGTLRGDLVAFIDSIADRAEMDTPLFAGLAHAALRDAQLAEVISKTLFAREAHVTGFVDRAVERGELRAMPAAAEFMGQLFFAMMISRPLFDSTFADRDYMVRFVDTTLLPALQHS